MHVFHCSFTALYEHLVRLKDDVLYNDINDIITIESLSQAFQEISISSTNALKL